MNKEHLKIKVDDLKVNQKNPKQHDDELIKSSIKDLGFVDDIVIDENNVILAGHGRLKALKELGMNEVDVIKISGWTQGQKDRYLLLSNKSVEQGGWDIAGLKAFDMDLLKSAGFADELDNIFKIDLGEKDDQIPELPKEIKVKLGDMFQLDKHRIYCGNATNQEDLTKLMNGQKAKLCFTSPPYNMDAKMYENYQDNLKSQEYIDFNLEVVNNVKKFLQGFMFWNISYNKNSRWEFIEIIYRIIKETNLKFLELIVWNKKTALPITSQEMLTRQYEDILLMGDEESIQHDLELWFCGSNKQRAYFNKKTNQGVTNYWEIPVNNVQLKNHLACYPVALPVKGILLMTQPEDIVFDPFLGSGTNIVACEKTNRVCYGLDIAPEYIEVSLKRWADYTGKDPIRLNDNQAWSKIHNN